MTRRKTFTLIALAGIALLGMQATQAQLTTATISGTVADTTGAVIPGVSVSVLQVETGTSRDAVSDDEGRYRVPETVDIGHLGENERLFLFVVLQDGIELDQSFVDHINEVISQELSPRHLPDEIYQVAEVPRTLSGKKLEVPVKRILSGIPVEEALSKGALANPEAMRFFTDLAAQLRDSPDWNY